MNRTITYTQRLRDHACTNTCQPLEYTDTDRLRRLDGHETVVPFLPAHVAKGPVVCDVLGDVGDLMDCMVVL